MKFRLTFTTLLVLLCAFTAMGQQRLTGKNALETGVRNYKTFTKRVQDRNPEVAVANKGFERHPELGILFAEAPCENCYELIGNRTENTKTYIKEGTRGSEIMQQTSTAAMHYQDAHGNWRTIKSQLEQSKTPGVYAASEQPVPVTISTTGKYVSLGKGTANIRFNNNLELVYIPATGAATVLGNADWSHHTAGDDGMYVTNAWPGIDIEMYVVRGAVKTNFIINHALPAYSGGKLLVRDHMQMADGLSLYADGKTVHTGNMEVRSSNGERAFAISAATAYEKFAPRTTLRMLEYNIAGNVLDIVVPGDMLNRSAASYPLVIDPLVTASTNVAVNGSTYSPTKTVGCTYTNNASVPAKVTVTDVQFSFQYLASGGALVNNGFYDLTLGTCRSPGIGPLWWSCTSPLGGSCTASNASIGSTFSPCLPSPQCAGYTLSVVMKFYQDFATEPACGVSYISSGSPLNITVFGHTIDANSVTSTPGIICPGQSATLTAAVSNGVPPYSFTWAPGPISGSTVNVTPASTTVYTITATDACSETAVGTTTVSVNPASTISGTMNVCQGNTTQLSNTAAGGTWSSANSAVATISTTGLVFGVSAGTAVISYITPSTCYSTATITVNSLPGSITGANTVCAGSTTALSYAAGGTWTSSNTTIATVNSSGVVRGVSGGMANITYTANTGCNISTSVTVYPLGPIMGSLTPCVGGTITLSNAGGAGSWTSSNSSVATITATTGVLSAVATGTSIIVYTSSQGCVAATTVTVGTLAAISGNTTICQGTNTNLSNSSGGGTWSSSNTGIATINTVTGVMGGVSGGSATISYVTGGGCYATTTVTVNPISPILGATTVCQGSSTILSNATPGGTWSSSNSNVATIVFNTGVVSGASSGSATIVYSTPAGCSASIPISVTALPSPITGNTNLCNNTILSDATMGGVWASSNTAIFTIGAVTGAVTGISPGTATVTYTIPGGCSTTTPITVNIVTTIAGSPVVCAGSTVTLSNGTAGGTWSSSNTNVATADELSGVITGITAGTTTITYRISAGCSATRTFTVNAIGAITGNKTVCQGSTTRLSDAASGGTWSSSAAGIATVTLTTGIVTGVSGGNVVISYSMPGGCFATTSVTVNPIMPITGGNSACEGSTLTLSDATAGGTWSSATSSVATIDQATGVVSAVSTGTTVIHYTTSAGCDATKTITVNPLPANITGNTTVCQGQTTTLSTTPTGGNWTSGATGVATVSASGVVTGVSAGNTNITYTTTAGCATMITVTVNATAPITGISNVCTGATRTLSNAVTGGVWSSANSSLATVDPGSGVVTGVNAGGVSIRYTTAAGCVLSFVFTVNATPTAITGNTTVCQGNTTSLSNTVGGGLWLSASSGVATISTGTGIVTGVTPGTADITYTTPAGCEAATVVTVNARQSITGTPAVCAGVITMLSNTITGGTWTSSNSGIATVDPVTGYVSGASAGTVAISYTTTLGCISSVTVTVHPLPTVIGGPGAVCTSSSTALSNGITGGVWTSGNTGVATINAGTGVITGVSAGSVMVTYVTAAGCMTKAAFTVHPLPDAITGIVSICKGATTILSDATPGGTWSSGSSVIATIQPSTGVLTGVNAGTTIATYTSTLGCLATTTVTINPLPSAITGSITLCEGYGGTLSNTLAGGTWSISNTAIATINTLSGTISALAAGTAAVTYITPAGCYTVRTVTVNPTPTISSIAFTNPTTCVTTDGTITLNGLAPSGTYTVSFLFGTTPTSLILTANSSGQVVITGLAAGTYSNIRVRTTLGCNSDAVAGPVTLVLPPAPAAPVAGNNAPLCDGERLELYVTSATPPGVTYSWTGPAGFASAAEDPIINPAHVTHSGVYSVTASRLGCVSAVTTTTVVIHPIPAISSFAFTNPTTCFGSDGTLTLSGLTPGLSYFVTWIFNGITPANATVTADAGGNVVVAGLTEGAYTDISLSSFGCVSNTVGPVKMTDPVPPPPSVLTSNAPLCPGQTLHLTSTNPVTSLTYRWAGPGGFTSNQQNADVPHVTEASEGTYSLTVSRVNCDATSSIDVIINPAAHLTDVTPDQAMAYGAYVQLNASGVQYYTWTPNNGTLSNPNIYNPKAAPDTATTYTVFGMNEFGCRDSAKVNITINYDAYGAVPTAFSPNGDGHNDVFRVINQKFVKIIDFSIYNRWGKRVYHNTYDPAAGWDGTFNGVPQDIGVYFYHIVIETPTRKVLDLKGDLTLIR